MSASTQHPCSDASGGGNSSGSESDESPKKKKKGKRKRDKERKDKKDKKEKKSRKRRKAAKDSDDDGSEKADNDDKDQDFGEKNTFMQSDDEDDAIDKGQVIDTVRQLSHFFLYFVCFLWSFCMVCFVLVGLDFRANVFRSCKHVYMHMYTYIYICMYTHMYKMHVDNMHNTRSSKRRSCF
jgi:hypothetical protein